MRKLAIAAVIAVAVVASIGVINYVQTPEPKRVDIAYDLSLIHI